jgi:DNA-binding Lrp family transcriptional regulator
MNNNYSIELLKDNRAFKGIWFPKEIWFNEELSLIDKCVLMEIDSLDNESHCTASNNYLASFIGCSETSVSKSISKLIDLNYIKLVKFDGRNRVLQSNMHYCPLD